MKNINRLTEVTPSQRQLSLQELEFYAFFHFTINTFTGKEWGDGTESPSIFDPKKLDVTQWVNAIKSAGMKAAILTCKHHDGFCLWQSKYTEHSVKNSPYKNGQGDIVRELSEACKKAGIKFGVYLSPWDRNNSTYGKGKEYDDYFLNQLTELLTQYGDICSVWFDGACGEGANGKVQKYDWERYYTLIRELQPNACIHICGPDIRWCGNEAGHTRKSEWSVVSKRVANLERIASSSQQSDDTEFRLRDLSSQDEDLGSREALELEKDLMWYPAEVDVSIRPGWFYHEAEDSMVKSADELFELYLKTVGGNCTLLLNIPPNKEGLIHDIDVKNLAEMGNKIRNAFKNNIIDQNKYDYEFIKEKEEIVIDIEKPNNSEFIVLQEDITKSQRIEAFKITINDGEYEHIDTVVGYKKIIRLPKKMCVNKLKIKLISCRDLQQLSFIGVFDIIS